MEKVLLTSVRLGTLSLALPLRGRGSDWDAPFKGVIASSRTSSERERAGRRPAFPEWKAKLREWAFPSYPLYPPGEGYSLPLVPELVEGEGEEDRNRRSFPMVNTSRQLETAPAAGPSLLRGAGPVRRKSC